MYTVESLLSASAMGRHMLKHGQKRPCGVLSSAEALERSYRTGTIVIISSSKRNVFFLSDDHIFGYPLLPDDFVSSTMKFPMRVVARPEVPDGWVNSVEKLIDVFESGRTQINSIEELVEYLNS
jgi:hypothetical protein